MKGAAGAREYRAVSIALQREVTALTSERDALIERLNSKNVLSCVYCGKPYPPGTPRHGTQVLTDHIRVCPKHPLRAAEAQIARLTEHKQQLIEAGDKLAADVMKLRRLPIYVVEEWKKCSSPRLSWKSGGHCVHCEPMQLFMKGNVDELLARMEAR